MLEWSNQSLYTHTHTFFSTHVRIYARTYIPLQEGGVSVSSLRATRAMAPASKAASTAKSLAATGASHSVASGANPPGAQSKTDVLGIGEEFPFRPSRPSESDIQRDAVLDMKGWVAQLFASVYARLRAPF